MKEASYYWLNSWPTKESPIAAVPGGVCSKTKSASFYTFDGDLIATLPYGLASDMDLEGILDPKALRPQPASFRKVWCPAIPLGMLGTKGAPGYAVLLHDKNGNRFAWARDDTEVQAGFDMSKAQEEPAEFTRAVAANRDGDTDTNALSLGWRRIISLLVLAIVLGFVLQ